MTSEAVEGHHDRCNQSLRILQPRSVRQSWEIGIDGRFDDSLRRDYESDSEGSRNVECDEGCESGVWANEIFPSVVMSVVCSRLLDAAKKVRRKKAVAEIHIAVEIGVAVQ
jgi:hypothetical protein